MSYTVAEARELLADYAAITEPGTVYTLTRSVARSGMSRRLDVYVIATDHTGQPYPARITHLVAAFLGYSSDPDRGMLVRGCGMDMGFHVVYSLSRAFHRDTDTADASHSDPGYLLTHRWM